MCIGSKMSIAAIPMALKKAHNGQVLKIQSEPDIGQIGDPWDCGIADN